MDCRRPPGIPLFRLTANQAFAIPGSPDFFLDQRTTNFFAGFGPHAGLELEDKIQGTGLSLIGKADFATILGRVHQGFLEASSVPPPGSPFCSSEVHVSGSQDVPMVTTDAGIGWQPPAYPFAQFFLGYHFEYWWNAGRLSTSGYAVRSPTKVSRSALNLSSNCMVLPAVGGKLYNRNSSVLSRGTRMVLGNQNPRGQ